MTLIHFTDVKDGMSVGISAGHSVALLQSKGNGWEIRRCIGVIDRTPIYQDVFAAQQACNAYLSKFLLDIGFVPGNHAVTK